MLFCFNININAHGDLATKDIHLKQTKHTVQRQQGFRGEAKTLRRIIG